MKLSSREYKVMLDSAAFADRRTAVDAFRSDVEALARSVKALRAEGGFDRKASRTIIFLDTPDRAIRRAGFLLRRRMDEDGVEYTLKCRSEDVYFADGADLRPGDGFASDDKLEEDIAPPFHCRFSHSNTVTPPRGDDLRSGTPPATVKEAARIFPTLRTLTRDGRDQPGKTPLQIVNDLTAFERVYAGPRLVFDDEAKGATAALILWSDGKAGRPLVAEFSFRVKKAEEWFTQGRAVAGRSFFEALQDLKWCRPNAPTKTGFVYRDTGGE